MIEKGILVHVTGIDGDDDYYGICESWSGDGYFFTGVYDAHKKEFGFKGASVFFGNSKYNFEEVLGHSLTAYVEKLLKEKDEHWAKMSLAELMCNGRNEYHPFAGEKVLCAAIMHRNNDGFELGLRYQDMLEKYGDILSDSIGDRGFLTSRGKFVSGEDAVKIAVLSGQVPPDFKKSRLDTEDLY